MAPTSIGDYDESLLRRMYRRMRLIREVEATHLELVEGGETPGNAHLSTGQEAVAVGTCFALRPDDVIGGTHRSHGHVLAKGTDVNALIAEFGGKVTGLCEGRGGEMHLFDPGSGVLETTGIVGANPPHVAGAVLAATLDGRDRVGVAFFGDGASNQGVVWETVNLAAVWNLPVVFCCENNGYAVSTPRADAVAGERIAGRAAGYGIDGTTVDGQDVLAVYDAASAAVESARAGGGPQFVECETYRFDGHFSMESVLLEGREYRTDEEVREWRERRDPIAIQRERLVEAGVATAGELDAVDDEVAAEVDAAVEAMRGSDFPPADRVLRAMYADDDYPDVPQPRYR